MQGGRTGSRTVTHSADRDALIVAASPDAILVLNAEGVVTRANPAAAELLGADDQELTHRRLPDVLPPTTTNAPLMDWLGALCAGLAEPEESGRVVDLERLDGTVLHVEVSGRKAGAAPGGECVAFLRDVTTVQKALRRASTTAARYEAITRNAVHALIVCAEDPEDSIIVTARSVLGYDPGTPLPKGFISLVHPADRAQTREVLDSVRRAGPSTKRVARARLRTKAGSWMQCEYIAEDLTHDPAVGGVIVRAADITLALERQHEVESTTARLKLLIDNLGAAVLLEDENRKVLVANQLLVDTFGIPMAPEDMPGIDCAEALEEFKMQFADPDGYADEINALIAGGVEQRGAVVKLANGHELERDYLPILTDSRPAGHMWAYRDVSKQVATNRLLTQENQSLAELAALKNEFVARVSHELRSPLTSVVSFADMLAESTAGSLSADENNFLEIINRNATRLLRLIEDLLLMAKLESHTLPMALGLVNLSEITEQTVAELQPRAKEKGLTLEIQTEDGPRIRADVLRIQQVVANLVTNALNYTPEGGTVRVRVAPSEDGRWEFAVSDTGVGIDREDVPHLFDAFFRAATSATVGGGTGLGLAIVRLIVDAHKGNIDVDSTPGEGTRVSVYLPYDEA